MYPIGKRAGHAFAVGALSLVIGETACGATIYVNDAASTGGDGSEWAMAYKCLSDGLAAADSIGD